MKYSHMEFLKEELIGRGIIQNGTLDEINPTEIKLLSLGIILTEQNNNYILLEDGRNMINILTDNKYTTLDYIISIYTYN